LCILVLSLGAPLSAQTPASGPLGIGHIGISGSLRTRVESWDWFGGSPNGEYTYPGSLLRLAFSQSKKTYDWQLELALPFILDLPTQAIGPGAQGSLGLGANYFSANNGRTDAAMLFAKQAFVRFKKLGGIDGQSVAIGRMEFVDGTEASPKNATLAALKRDRIAHRLIGNFGFSHVGRSLDGVRYAIDGSKMNFTFVGARPTRGVFQVDGWGELNVNVFYGALTQQVDRPYHVGEWRVFVLGYRDYREDVVKTDNRPLAVRQIDTDSIDISTFGGHYVSLVDTPAGPVDTLVWGAVQVGSWGTLAQRAGAFAGEAGWQPPILANLKPWLRGGYDYGSGDSDPNDQRHGTFFQVLPTPRVYARFPFFNSMNIGDGFGELILRPLKRFTVRADVHALRLADKNDLWYQGGGAFQPGTFGYTGRASGGASNLATLYDVSGDCNINAGFSIAAYYSAAMGGLVTRTIYPTGNQARFGYLEVLIRF
jgi:hypothetical protein